MDEYLFLKNDFYMDAAFEVYIPKNSDLGIINFQQPFYEWEGVKYIQGSPEYKFGDKFTLRENDELSANNHKREWPTSYLKIDFQCIEISGIGLDIYVDSIYNFRKEKEFYTLEDLLRLLLKNIGKWVFVYSYQYDGYNNVLQGDIEGILLNLEYYIKNESTGFMLYK